MRTIYKVTVEKTTVEDILVKKNFIVKSTPTEITEKSDYGNNVKVKCVEEYKTEDVKEEKVVKSNIYEQYVAELDLVVVINAVNKIKEKNNA